MIQTLRADPPAASYLFPAGGQRGTTVQVLVGGLNLTPSCNFEIVGPGVKGPSVVKRVDSLVFEGPLLPLPESQRLEDYPRSMAAAIAVAKDAPLGNRFTRMWTAQGVTLPMPFVVGDLPEIIEKELEGTPIPVAVKFPAVVNGRIHPREDVDIWTVTLKKGEALNAAIAAAVLSSPLDARLTIHDGNGKKLAESRDGLRSDPTLRFTAPADGDYQVHVTDVRGDGGPAFVYRLTLSPPLAASREPSPSSAVAETTETLTAPLVGSGTIGQAGEVDLWKIKARAGEGLDIDLQAQRLGSPLFGVLSVQDEKGKSLGQAEAGVSDPTLRFVAPADGVFTVSVQDRFKNRGGADFAYRLRVAHDRPDFELQLSAASLTVEQSAASPKTGREKSIPLKITATRRGGFNGPIAIKLDGLPPGVAYAKEPIIAANQTSVDLALKADASAKIDSFVVKVVGTGLVPLVPLTAMPVPTTRTATFKLGDDEIDHVRIAVALPTPFKIAGDFVMHLHPRGTIYTRMYRIERNDYAGPITIELADRQARHLQGVTAKPLEVPAEATEFEYAVELPPWMETGRTCRVCVMGTAIVKDADGRDHVVTYSSKDQNDQMIAVVEPERLGLKLDRATLRVEAGAEVEIGVTVSRGDKLTGPAQLEMVIPRHFQGVTADLVQVAADSSTGKLRLKFAKDAVGQFNLPLMVRAVVMENGRPVVAEAKVELVR